MASSFSVESLATSVLTKSRKTGLNCAPGCELDALKINPTVTLNARVCETYPVVVQACVDAGWELNAHSYDQVPMHKIDDRYQEVVT